MGGPILYILMRADLASMNPGKGMAQAAHAANAFVHAANHRTDQLHVLDGVQDWQRQTPQHFGTTIVLAVPDEDTLRKTVSMASALGFPAEVIHDPTYPVRDGAVTHFLPIDTCAYVFSPDPERYRCYPLEELDLHA